MPSAASPIAVVCAIIVNDDLVLLARRPEGKRLAGLWEFPGGKVDGNETPVEALHRELKEELECRVTVTRSLTPVVHAYEWGSIALHPFVCALAAGSPPPHPHEHSDLVWAKVEDLPSYALAPADRPVVAQLLAADSPLMER